MAEAIGLRFEIDNKQLNAFSGEILNRWKKANDMTTPLKSAANYMRGEIERNFAGAGSVWEKWARRKVAYRHPILQKTKTMRKGFVSKVNRHEAVITNPVKYFKYHQLGTRRGLPARKMWGINETQAHEIEQKIQKYLFEENKR